MNQGYAAQFENILLLKVGFYSFARVYPKLSIPLTGLFNVFVKFYLSTMDSDQCGTCVLLWSCDI